MTIYQEYHIKDFYTEIEIVLDDQSGAMGLNFLETMFLN